MTNNSKQDPSIYKVAQWADEINEQIRDPKIEAISEIKSENKNIHSSLESILSILGNKRDNNKYETTYKTPYMKTENNNKTTRDKLPADGICYFHRKFGNNRHENKKYDQE